MNGDLLQDETATAAAGDRHQDTRRQDRRRRLPGYLLAGALLIGGAIAAVAAWHYRQSYESTDDAQIDGHILPISSRVQGTVLHIYVEDTYRVNQGQVLVELDPRDFEVALEKANADLAQANAALQGAKADYQVALANLNASVATNLKAQHDLGRRRALLASRVVSRDQYEEYERQARVAQAQQAAARAQMDSALKAIATRQAQVQAAQAQVDQAKLNLSYTRIAAPRGGEIGKKTVELGQRVEPGQELLAVVPLDDLWVTANFKETELARMRPGQPVTIRVDALAREFQGYLEGVGAASGEKFSLLPPENATGNYVKIVQRVPVRIRFLDDQEASRRLRPGMSVEPTVWLERRPVRGGEQRSLPVAQK